MKGLDRIPSLALLENAYEKLQNQGEKLPVISLALFSQWSRLDPRLGEILIGHLNREWKNIPSGALNDALLMQPWPAALGVLIEHLPLLDPPLRKTLTFRAWRQSVLASVAPASGELYFLGLHAFAGKWMREDAELALEPYLKWGYLSRELMLHEPGHSSRDRTTLPAATRKRLLKDALQAHSHLSVRLYQELAGGKVSRRQAERDLKGSKRLAGRGNTRGRFYVKK